MCFATFVECWGLEMRKADVGMLAIFGVIVLVIARVIDVIALIIDGFLGWILCGILLLFG